ncbi:MAG: hypothetical protein SH850_27945 [Planctomycetaceae bacterium]|nr:hypothetical protein [Planctomycetaceae bacterium]
MPTPLANFEAAPAANPTDFTAAVLRRAEQDAEAVASFLTNVMPAATGTESMLPISAEALLGIALAIRLRSWELQEIRLHIDAGMPSGREVLLRVFTEVAGATLKEFIRTNSIRALKLFHDQFLWSLDDLDLEGEIAILVEADDAFLEAVADFLIEQSKGTA